MKPPEVFSVVRMFIIVRVNSSSDNLTFTRRTFIQLNGVCLTATALYDTEAKMRLLISL
jgi:hypothetical protein